MLRQSTDNLLLVRGTRILTRGDARRMDLTALLLVLSLVVALGFIAGCEPSRAPAGGVVAVFGGVGLQPGQFAFPRAITADTIGTVFVVDKSGRVQRFSNEGALEAGWRMPQIADGKPVGLYLHNDGRLFIADTHYHRVLITDRDGSELGSFGRFGMGDGEFQLPTDVAVDAKGFIYVSEYLHNDRITKWSPEFEFVGVLGEELIADEPLRRPAGIDIDDEQTLWVADACNHRLVRYSLDGEVLAVFGEFGDAPGQMKYPYDVDTAPDGSIMVCEYGGNRLQWFTKDGRSLRTWGGPGRKRGELHSPWGATYGPDGNVYVVDALNNRVQIVKP